MVVYDNMDLQDPPTTLFLLTDNLEIRHLTGYTCDMSSPCRRVVYHPLKNCGYIPESNSEIYVQGLPSDTTDSELMEFFQQCGNIFKLKVMLVNGNTNRGFCFVTFMNSEVAKSSLYLNCVPFRPDCFLRISISYNNRRIFLGNIPLSKSRDDVWKELAKNGVTNITDVIMYRGYADRAQNRGFVFVEFEGHEQAAGFRARFENQLFLWDKKIIIDWSVPLPIVDDSIIDQATTIFMRNLPVTFGREELQQLLYKLMRKENIQRVYKFKNYAFVHLFERSQAEELMKILQEHYRDDIIEIEWAKPPSKYTSPSYRSQRVNSLTRGQRYNSTSSNSPEKDSRSNSGLMVNSPSPIQASQNRHGVNYPGYYNKSPSPTGSLSLYNQYFKPMASPDSTKTEKYLDFLGNDYKWYNQSTPTSTTTSTYRSQITSNTSRPSTLSPSASSSLGSPEHDVRHTSTPVKKNDDWSNGVELTPAGHLPREFYRYRHGESYPNPSIFTTSRTQSNVEPRSSHSSMERFYGRSSRDLANITVDHTSSNQSPVFAYQQAMHKLYGNENPKVSNAVKEEIKCCEFCSNLHKLLI